MVQLFNYGDREAALFTMRRISTMIETGLGDMVARDDKLSSEFHTALAGIEAETSASEPSLTVLAGYVQSAIRQPALASGIEMDDRIEAFTTLSGNVLALLSDIEPGGYGRWVFRAVELTQCAIVTSLSRIVTTATPASRSHAIKTADDLLTEFSDIVDALDTAAAEFDDQVWDLRCFSQTSAYTVLSTLVSKCVAYLLRSAYDLKIEKRFTLARPTGVVALAIEHYPDVDIDVACDLLIKANELSGDDILLMASGREIVVYV